MYFLGHDSYLPAKVYVGEATILAEVSPNLLALSDFVAQWNVLEPVFLEQLTNLPLMRLNAKVI